MDKSLELLKEYRRITHFYVDKSAGATLSRAWSTDGKTRNIVDFVEEVDKHILKREKENG